MHEAVHMTLSYFICVKDLDSLSILRLTNVEILTIRNSTKTND